MGGIIGGPTGSQLLGQVQQQQTDQLQQSQILTQMQANQQTTAADNLKTQSDAQNHVFKDQQESVLTRVKTSDELNGKWDKIIGGDGGG